MEDLASQFITCFNVLRSNDPDEVPKASQMICELAKDENSIGILSALLQENEDAFIRFQAANALKISLAGYDKNSFNPEILINSLLTHLSQEPENQIRVFLANFIGKKLINQENFQLAIGFSQAALESTEQIQIFSAILLLNECVESFKDVNAEFIQFIANLTLSAVEFNDNELTLNALEFYFCFVNKFVETNDDVSNKLWADSISLFSNLIEDPYSLHHISKIIGDCIDFGAMYVDIEPLLPICIELINREDLDDYIQNDIIYVIDSIITVHPEVAIQLNLVSPIFQKYVEIAIQEYSPEESIDLYNFSIMENICQEFSSNEDFVSSVWSTVQGFPQNDQGRYVSSMVLYYLFNSEMDLFYENFDAIVELISNSLASESTATCEAGIKCLYKFIDVFTDIEDYIDTFEHVIIEILKTNANLSLVEALTEVMKCSESTDNIFEEVFPILYQSISNSTAEANLTIIYSLSILASRSFSGVLNHYEVIINLLQEILGSEQEEAQILKGGVVDCINNLMRVSPDSFQSALESFIPIILNYLTSNDSNLVCGCLNCIGTMNDLYPEELKPYVPDLLKITSDFAANDLSQKFTKVRNLMEEGFSNEEITEFDDETIIEKDTFKISGGAFMVFCSLLSKNPELIPENFELSIKLIQILSESMIDDSNTAVCAGVEFLLIGVNEIDVQFDPELIEKIYLNLKYIIDKTENITTVGRALRAIGAVIHAFGLGSLGNQITSLPLDIVAIMTQNLSCFHNERIESTEVTKEDELPECLYEPIHCVLLTLFDMLKEDECQEFMKDIIPTVFELASKSEGEKAFALDILINYAQHGFNPDAGFLPNVLNLAIDCCSHNYNSGFVAIEMLCLIAPDLMRENAEKILGLFWNQLTSESKSQKNHQRMDDDCLSALSIFAVKVLDDDFPLDQFGKVALSKMPPKKDYDTVVNCYSFLNWMIPRGIEYLKNDFIAAFARLFALPPKIFKRMNIDPENLELFKISFSKLMQVINDSESICSEAVGGDPLKMQLIQNVLNS